MVSVSVIGTVDGLPLAPPTIISLHGSCDSSDVTVDSDRSGFVLFGQFSQEVSVFTYEVDIQNPNFVSVTVTASATGSGAINIEPATQSTRGYDFHF